MSRRKKHEEHENHERWLVSYADFITLLFAFFVVMYATSTNDEDKQKEFEDSVRAELKLVSVGGRGGTASGGGGIDPNDSLVPELINPIDRFPRRGGPMEVQDYVERQLKQSMTPDQLVQSGIELRRDSRGARLSFPADLYYPVGDTKLKKSGLFYLDRVADVLKKVDRQLIIEGHTDGDPAIADNWDFASQRSASMLRYLIKYRQIEASRLAMMSYANQKPLGPNDTNENKAKNRRIEILISTEQSADHSDE